MCRINRCSKGRSIESLYFISPHQLATNHLSIHRRRKKLRFQNVNILYWSRSRTLVSVGKLKDTHCCATWSRNQSREIHNAPTWARGSKNYNSSLALAQYFKVTQDNRWEHEIKNNAVKVASLDIVGRGANEKPRSRLLLILHNERRKYFGQFLRRNWSTWLHRLWDFIRKAVGEFE